MSGFTTQQRAAITGQGNLLVVAGAGTGKTQTLVARCLRLVTEERLSLENILMVTFTEAAAAEMRGRIREELQRLQIASPGDEHLAEQLALLDTAHISTLHSFCLQLAREHFHELGLDPQFSVLDEQQTHPLQRETLDELLEKHYIGTDAESHAVQELIRAIGRGSDYSIRQLVLKLHAYTQSLPDPERWLKQQEARFTQPEPTEWREAFREAVTGWRNDWLEELKSFAGAAPAVALCLGALDKLRADSTSEGIAVALRNVVEANANDDNWPRGTKGKVRDPLKEFFDSAGFLASLLPDENGIDPLKQDWEWTRHHLVALVLLTREFTNDFAKRKRELGGVDFADLEQCALRLLYDPAGGATTDAAHVWRERLEHIFVDEYQDINAAQDAILTALSYDGTGQAFGVPLSGGMNAGPPESGASIRGNRFMVGDVEQSIYRFRLANPKIFRSYQKDWSHGADGARTSSQTQPQPAGKRGPAAADASHTAALRAKGRALALTENFRSRGALLDFINPLFAMLMREEIGGVNYEPLGFGVPVKRAALAATGDAPCVELHLIARGEEQHGGEDAETETDGTTKVADLLAVEREARLVARRLRDLKTSGHKIWDGQQQEFREVKWSDMAVLLRSPSGRAEAFAMEFSKAGVPLIAARDGFFASLEVSDLLNLLRLLDNPLQDVPLAAVLRSPLVGLSLGELAQIRAHNAARPFWTALARFCEVHNSDSEAALHAKVQEFFNQYHRWRELVRQTSLSQCLETALTETHYEAILLAGERGVERAANVRRLLDLARQFDPYQRQGLYRFLRFVEAQEEEELDMQPGMSPAEDGVRLISIHKSKGLEFPVVALTCLGTRFNERDLNEPVLVSEHWGLCPKITPPDREQQYPSLPHWLARRGERRELLGEELRLLYVATTRARDALILSGTTSRKGGGAKWKSTPPGLVSTSEVGGARSHLEWLLTWLPRATTEEDWRSDRGGENRILRWRIYDEDDTTFQEEVPSPSATLASPPKGETGDAELVEQLKGRLAWQYPFGAATVEPAKTSVSLIRKRAVDEMDDEARSIFGTRADRSAARKRTVAGATVLSAAERGSAHHRFLELLDLQRAGSEKELLAEAGRIAELGLMKPEQIATLDFVAITSFWQSDLGQRIRANAGCIRRELAFTARFITGELAPITRAKAQTDETGDFVVVQGVADLVVLRPKEIWLVDFKTDEVTPGEVPAKAKFYEPQLKLYALALDRIYGRRVTESWLHFLTPARTVRVEE